jgi:hypothetical protein
MSNAQQTLLQAKVEHRRVLGSLQNAMKVGTPGAQLTIFHARYDEGYWAFLGPAFYITALKNILLWGAHEEHDALREFIGQNVWFPAACGTTPTKAINDLSSKMESIDDGDYMQVLHGLYALRFIENESPTTTRFSPQFRSDNFAKFLASCFPEYKAKFFS